MKFCLILATACISLSLPAAQARAQSPGQVPPHDAQFAPEQDVSTLNGELVPVGEKNRYRYSFRRFNVSSNPVGLMLGLYGASISYAPSQIVAVRLDVNYFQPADTDFHGVEFGVGAPIYFRKMYSGFFLEPGLIYRSATGESDDSDTDDGFDAFGPQVLLGWHWYWDTGLNVAMAFGGGRKFSKNDDESESFANGYLRVGYAF